MTTPDPHGTPGQPPQGYPQAGYPQAGAPQGYPQQGYPQQGYPQAGTPPQGYPSFPAANPMSEGEPTPRPKSVDRSFLLWLASAGLSLLTLVFTTLNTEATFAEANARLTEAGLPVDPAEFEASTSVASMAFTVAFTVVLTAVWIAVAFAMRNGANWARIVLTVIGSLTLVFGGLLGLLALPVLFSIGALGVVEALLNIASIPLMLAAIVYMFTGGAGRYFATR